MQFHQNGFHNGDPHRLPQARTLPVEAHDEADVLIVGCGPAGLTLAAQLSAFADIRTVIAEQKPGPLELGQADGVACRTMEMFEAFNFSERVLKEAYWVNETTFWTPDATDPTRITRSGRIQDTEDGLSEFPHVILNQARVHQFYLDTMCLSPRRLEPRYSRRFSGLEIDTQARYPVRAAFERVDKPGQSEFIKARYLVGCDGARSAVRQAIGLDLSGDSANQAWGVMDVLAVTNFPDIRFKSVIRSAREGNVLIIPREGGYLVRIYVEMDKLASDERVANRNISVEQLVEAARRVLNPYTLDVKEIVWWSVYEIGQRLCEQFDNAAESRADEPTVFITGDACHTHSPKAGQGMNVSMGDGFNLGWKLTAVLRGQAKPELLRTYSLERQGVAQDLIDFDRDWAKRFSERPKIESGMGEASDNMDSAAFQQYFTEHGRYTAGVSVRYQPSLITAENTYQQLAAGFTIGMRFHSAPVVRLADAKPLQLGHAVKADGRWRLFAFADSTLPTQVDSRIWRLCDYLAHHRASPINAYRASDSDIDAVIDVRAIFQQDHRRFDIDEMHPFLLPHKGQLGLQDTEKMFCANQRSGENIFEMREIDRERGAIVIVRPDQYVAHILPLDDHQELSSYFARFLLQPIIGRQAAN